MAHPTDRAARLAAGDAALARDGEVVVEVSGRHVRLTVLAGVLAAAVGAGLSPTGLWPFGVLSLVTGAGLLLSSARQRRHRPAIVVTATSVLVRGPGGTSEIPWSRVVRAAVPATEPRTLHLVLAGHGLRPLPPGLDVDVAALAAWLTARASLEG